MYQIKKKNQMKFIMKQSTMIQLLQLTTDRASDRLRQKMGNSAAFSREIM